MFGLGIQELVILAILLIIIPLIIGIVSAVQTKESKVLFFSAAYTETLGFIFCISIILMPVGVLLVLFAESVKVQYKTEKNTRDINKLP